MTRLRRHPIYRLAIAALAVLGITIITVQAEDIMLESAWSEIEAVDGPLPDDHLVSLIHWEHPSPKAEQPRDSVQPNHPWTPPEFPAGETIFAAQQPPATLQLPNDAVIPCFQRCKPGNRTPRPVEI